MRYVYVMRLEVIYINVKLTIDRFTRVQHVRFMRTVGV